MRSSETLADAFTRIREGGHAVVDGLGPDLLNARVAGRANSITWLVWHLTRVQDDHVSDVAGSDQVWTSGGWVARFDLPFEAADTGFGHDERQVQQTRVDDPALLTGYLDDAVAASLQYLDGLSDDDFDQIVDDSFDPPVTLGARLVSVVEDDLQHLGQAAFARGLLQH